MDQDARPPYVTFERKAVERKNADGSKRFDDVDFAYITPMGSKDRYERQVDEWFVQTESMVDQGRFERRWLDGFKTAYAAFKNDQEIPVDGTDLKLWPVLSPAQFKTLKNLRLRTVEDLAAANEEVLSRIGMGSRALKAQAQAWLKGQQKGSLEYLVSEVSALKASQEGLAERNKALEEQNAALKAQLAALATPA